MAAVLALLLITLAALVVRLFHLGLPMRFDEAYTFIHYASLDFPGVVSTYDTTNNHILNSVLIHFLTRLFGDSPEVIRLPALVAGVLLVPATYSAAAKLYGRYAALFAAALTAASSVMIEYSVNARGYTMIFLAFILLIRLAAGLKDQPKLLPWLGFSLVAALGFWAIPIMFYPYAVVAGWLFLSFVLGDSCLGRWRGIGLLCLSGLATVIVVAALYAPVFLSDQFESMDALNPDVTPKTVGYLLAQLPVVFADLGLLWVRDLPVVAVVAVAAFLVLSLVQHARVAQHKVPYHLLVLILIAGIVLVQRVVPYPRVMLFLYPLLAIWAGAGFAWLVQAIRETRAKQWTLPLFAVVVCVLASLLVARTRSVALSIQTGVLPDAQAAAQYIASEYEPGDRLLMRHPANEIMLYYFRRLDFPYEEWREQETRQSKRVFLLVNLAHKQRLEYLLRSNTIDLVGYHMELAAEFPTALVYEINGE